MADDCLEHGPKSVLHDSYQTMSYNRSLLQPQHAGASLQLVSSACFLDRSSPNPTWPDAACCSLAESPSRRRCCQSALTSRMRTAVGRPAPSSSVTRFGRTAAGATAAAAPEDSAALPTCLQNPQSAREPRWPTSVGCKQQNRRRSQGDGGGGFNSDGPDGVE